MIEWFFTSVSLAIETRYQNMAVMAVWRRRWKRHISVAIVTAVSGGIWASANLLVLVHERFKEVAERTIEQTTGTMPLAPKTIAAATLEDQ